MSSILRFDEWQDSNGVPVLDGAGGNLALGKILQVVSTTSTTIYSVTLTAGSLDSQDIPDLSASITPTSASSKLLVFMNISTGGNNNGYSVIIRRDGSSSAAIGAAAGSRNRITAGGGGHGADNMGTISMNYLDDASATSSTTYSVRIQNSHTTTQTYQVNKSEADPDSTAGERAISTLTIMEVAA
jgi:hypothetical protein